MKKFREKSQQAMRKRGEKATAVEKLRGFRLYSNNLSFQSQSVVLHFFFRTTSTAVSRL
jgi:hypothetical protein